MSTTREQLYTQIWSDPMTAARPTDALEWAPGALPRRPGFMLPKAPERLDGERGEEKRLTVQDIVS